ncbi:MAG TPA: class I SAM-dependent methyltransferase [Thermoanaerobaculia bacterium]|nr:class I SAM-dependent methyltransferase [Thermoanaerobaculia bacterium]
MADDRLFPIRRECDLAALAIGLGAEEAGPLTVVEKLVAVHAAPIDARVVAMVRSRIRQGHDPLGEAFCTLRDAPSRRRVGATYTPDSIVASMVAWARRSSSPARVVDIGSGSGRFAVAAGKAFRKAALVAVEIDPLAALLTRAHLAVSRLAGRSTVLLADYRDAPLPSVDGATLFIGNPPYVRHHGIEPRWKRWLTESANDAGFAASQLGGLHVHFFVRTLQLAKKGDVGVLITAAEWLDVNYGQLVRDLFVHRLGGKSIHFIEPGVSPFPDAQTTAVIIAFAVGSSSPTIRMKRVQSVAELGALGGGKLIQRERLEAAARWGPLFRPSRKRPEGLVELGEICSVHRGAVTGANRVWIAGEHSEGLPESVLFASVTKGRELIAAGATLDDDSALRRVIDLPPDLDVFDAAERRRIEAFLKRARSMGGDRGFIAGHRRAWWSVGLREPAPILATYMARRPPAFVRNLAGARHINIAHGLYPRETMTAAALNALAAHLAQSVSVSEGRTYAGGLTKFEPREMERLLVPIPASR